MSANYYVVVVSARILRGLEYARGKLGLAIVPFQIIQDELSNVESYRIEMLHHHASSTCSVANFPAVNSKKSSADLSRENKLFVTLCDI
jgi:hypothetical protein